MTSETHTIETDSCSIVFDLFSRRNGGERSSIGVLFVHGLASNRLMLTECANYLFDAHHHYEVGCVDLRGHGDSSAKCVGDEVDHFSLQGMAADVRAVIEHIRAAVVSDDAHSPWREPLVLVGHSYGANVVVEIALRYPSYVRGLVCVDGGFINLPLLYPTYEECENRLRPPEHLDFITVEQLEMEVRSKWCVGWSDRAVRAMMTNFAMVEDPKVPIHDSYMTVMPGKAGGASGRKKSHNEIQDSTRVNFSSIQSTDKSKYRVFRKLSTARHLLLLKDLYANNPLPKFEQISTPVLFISAGAGGPTHFSRSKVDDVNNALQRLRHKGSKAMWFRDSGHDITATLPAETSSAIHDYIVNSINL